MPTDMHVNWQGMPPDKVRFGTFLVMATKKPKDQDLEDRIRAHARFWMERYNWNTTKLSDKTGFDQGYLYRWFQGTRKTTSAALLKHLCLLFPLDPLALFKGEDIRPEDRFFGDWVPHEDENRDPRRAPLPPAQPAGRTPPKAVEPVARYQAKSSKR